MRIPTMELPRTRAGTGGSHRSVLRGLPDAGRDLGVVWIRVLEQLLDLAGRELVHQLVNVEIRVLAVRGPARYDTRHSQSKIKRGSAIIGL